MSYTPDQFPGSRRETVVKFVDRDGTTLSVPGSLARFGKELRFVPDGDHPEITVNGALGLGLSREVNTDSEIRAGETLLCYSPTLASGVIVTINSGAVWKIL